MRCGEDFATLHTVVAIHFWRVAHAIIDGVVRVRVQRWGTTIQVDGVLEHGRMYLGWYLLEAISRVQRFPREVLCVEGRQGAGVIGF